MSQRRRREYLALDFEQLLAEKGIDSNLLMPSHWGSRDEHATTPDNPVSPYLPLEVSLFLHGICILDSQLNAIFWRYSAVSHITLQHFSCRYLIMRTLIAALQKTGLLWAKLRDHLIENLFLQKHCCLQMTRDHLVKCPEIFPLNINGHCFLFLRYSLTSLLKMTQDAPR